MSRWLYDYHRYPWRGGYYVRAEALDQAKAILAESEAEVATLKAANETLRLRLAQFTNPQVSTCAPAAKPGLWSRLWRAYWPR